VLPSDATEPFMALAAAPASFRIRTVSPIRLLSSEFLNTTAAPGIPLGFWTGGSTGVKTFGGVELMSLP
jgi:hypothetical protein